MRRAATGVFALGFVLLVISCACQVVGTLAMITSGSGSVVLYWINMYSFLIGGLLAIAGAIPLGWMLLQDMRRRD